MSHLGLCHAAAGGADLSDIYQMFRAVTEQLKSEADSCEQQLGLAT